MKHYFLILQPLLLALLSKLQFLHLVPFNIKKSLNKIKNFDIKIESW